MLYAYKVKLDNCESPMYSTTRLLKDFGTDKDGAIEWAKNNHERYETGNKCVMVVELEYTCEENLKRDFALQTNCIWHKYW